MKRMTTTVNNYEISSRVSDFFGHEFDSENKIFLEIVDFFRSSKGKTLLASIDKEPTVTLEAFWKKLKKDENNKAKKKISN
jgi:hypothetical protein